MCVYSVAKWPPARVAQAAGARRRAVGTVLRTRDGVKPVYVSVGHRIELPAAVHLVLDCGVRYRLPEPTRLADIRVAAVKREV